jgi:phosphatidylinositol dimannoside acyltransferase
MRQRTEWLAATGYGAGWSLLKSLPEGLAQRGFEAAADAAFRRRGARSIQLARNLHRVLGPDSTPAALAAVTRAGLRSYARYWRETFRLPAMDKHEVATSFLDKLAGLHHAQAAMAAGRGLIMPLPHSGNWDIAGLGMVQEFGGFATVAERLRPASLFDKFVSYRESLGFEVLPLTGGALNPTTVLRERLQQGKLICLVADRDLSARGVEVEFFGQPTRMPAGPAMLAAITGAALCPTHLYFTNHGWAGDVAPPVELAGARLRDQVRDGTQKMADIFAAGIADHPADWHMLQPLWLADLAPHHDAAGDPKHPDGPDGLRSPIEPSRRGRVQRPAAPASS